MRCPVDNTELMMAERQGVEIDYCPQCRGVWLDRGELDKIIERSDDDDRPRRDEPRMREQDYRGDQYRDQRHYGSHKPYKKKKSLLGEIFDF